MGDFSSLDCVGLSPRNLTESLHKPSHAEHRAAFFPPPPPPHSQTQPIYNLWPTRYLLRPVHSHLCEFEKDACALHKSVPAAARGRFPGRRRHPESPSRRSSPPVDPKTQTRQGDHDTSRWLHGLLADGLAVPRDGSAVLG